MPPWPADPEYVSFKGEKALTHNEKSLINNWIEAGAPEGNPKLSPPLPVFHDNSFLGKPDMVLQIPNPVFIKGDNQDKFYMLKIPFEFPQDTFIKAIEIVPGNKKLVHHVNAHIVQYDRGEKADHTKGLPYVDTEKHDKQKAYELLDLPNDDGTYPLLSPSVSNFLPGVEPVLYPEGIGGIKVTKQGVLLLDNMHYGPSPVDTSDQSSFNIFFSPSAPKRPLKEMILGTSGITRIDPPLIIPPDTVMSFTTEYRVPSDMSIVTINPHMHLLGKSFHAYAMTPSGDTIRLIRIPEWDFKWQYFYTYKKIQKIPARSVIKVHGVFDNTSANPNNPFDPPRTVTERAGSMRTTDEMFQLIISWMPYQNGDENISLE